MQRFLTEINSENNKNGNFAAWVKMFHKFEFWQVLSLIQLEMNKN